MYVWLSDYRRIFWECYDVLFAVFAMVVYGNADGMNRILSDEGLIYF